MDRKLNLAKLAKNKNVLPSVKNTGIIPTQSLNTNSSPYFSPIANRTRNKGAKKAVNLVKEIEKKSTATTSESIKKVEKKLINQKHIKLENDESKKPDVKSEIEKVSTASSSDSIAKVGKKAVSRKHIKLEYDENVKPNVKSEIDNSSENKVTSNTKNETKKRKSNDKTSSGSVPEASADEKQMKWQPKDWQQMFENIQKMRESKRSHCIGC